MVVAVAVVVVAAAVVDAAVVVAGVFVVAVVVAAVDVVAVMVSSFSLVVSVWIVHHSSAHLVLFDTNPTSRVSRPHLG